MEGNIINEEFKYDPEEIPVKCILKHDPPLPVSFEFKNLKDIGK